MRIGLICTLVLALTLFPAVLGWGVRNALSRRLVFQKSSQLQFSSSNIVSERLNTALKFKVAESDVEEEEDVEEIDFDEDGGSSVLRKLSKGVVPIAASIGFAVTPSPAIALRLAGAAVGGVAGLVARKAIESRIQETDSGDGDDDNNGGGSTAVSASVAATLKVLKGGPPPSSLTLKKIEQLARKNGVAADELGELFTYIFAEVIFEAVQSESSDLTELGEVIDFASSVGLTPAEIGDGFAVAAVKVARQLERDERGFYVNHPVELLTQAAKVFFLADKMVGTSEGYYGKRIAVGLSFFTNDELTKTITDACTALFKKCIESVLSSPADFTAEEVATLKEFLETSSSASKLRPANMQNMISEALQLTLSNALNKDKTSVMDSKIPDYDSLLKAQAILGWNAQEFDATVATRTVPVFEEAAKKLVEDTIERPEHVDEFRAKLEERMQALNIDRRRARVILTTIISDENNKYMSEIDKVYSASSNAVEPAFQIMSAYATAHDALKKLTEDVMGGADIPVPGLPFADMVRVSLYQLQLTKGKGVKEDMFNLNPEQQRIVRKNLALPKVTTWITQCINENNFDENAKNAYKKQLEQYGVSEKEWQATAIDFYYQETQKIAKTRAVPSQADMIRLNTVKEFLDCTEEAVSKTNLELFGDKYVKAVTEAMMPSGYITEEYLDGLERLRIRLGLSKEDTKSLMGVSARSRLVPVVKDLVDMWKSDTDATKRREKEMAGKKNKLGDPISSLDNVFGFMETGAQKEGGGPNVFMREAINLVDFFVENYVTADVDLKTVEALPVTAVGIVPEKELAGMFKHYLITRLAEQDENLRSRYVENERIFALILGITTEGQAKVKESLAYSAYKNMLKNVLRYKDAVETQDLQQFAILKDSLKLEPAVADRVLDEASRGALIEHAAGFIRPKDGTITAEMAQRFRNQVQSLGLSIQKDTGFNERLVTYMYALEVQYLVENGEESELKDVQEAYDIPEERAEVIVESVCRRYISQLLNLALRAARKYDERESVMYTKQIAKFARFVSGKVDADGNIFSEDDKKRMISFFENAMRDEDPAHVEEEFEIAEKLRQMVHLTEDFVPPVQGIDGLLGKVKGMEVVGDGDGGDDRKKWAWG